MKNLVKSQKDEPSESSTPWGRDEVPIQVPGKYSQVNQIKYFPFSNRF